MLQPTLGLRSVEYTLRCGGDTPIPVTNDTDCACGDTIFDPVCPLPLPPPPLLVVAAVVILLGDIGWVVVAAICVGEFGTITVAVIAVDTIAD